MLDKDKLIEEILAAASALQATVKYQLDIIDTLHIRNARLMSIKDSGVVNDNILRWAARRCSRGCHVN